MLLLRTWFRCVLLGPALWCVGREPRAIIRNIDAERTQGVKVTLAHEPADTKLTVELRDASGK